MFNKDKLESAEFYNHRFKNFATLSILPAFIFLICLIAFLIFAKREVAIKAAGEIAPTVSGHIVQSTVSSRIIRNYIKEGKFVKKGQVLVVYHDKSTPAEQRLVKGQAELLTTQSQALQQLKNSIEKNQNVMTGEDSFGYQQLFKDYLAQRSIYQSETSKIDVEQNENNSKTNSMTGAINKQIDAANADITDLNKLKQVIGGGQGSYPASGKFSALYKGYQADAKDLKGTELNKVQATYQQSVDQEIATNETNLNSLKIELVNTQKTDTSGLDKEEVQSKLVSLQANQLQNIDTQLVSIKKSLKEYTEKQAILEDQHQGQVIKAPASGVLHTDNNAVSKKLIGAGTELAEVLPQIQKVSTAKVTFLVGPSEVSAIKPGMKIRLKITRNVPRPFVLDGNVKKLDVGPTVTKQGNAFQVNANVSFSPEQAKQLRYGITGNVSVITGKKTYWHFIVDYILNKE